MPKRIPLSDLIALEDAPKLVALFSRVVKGRLKDRQSPLVIAGETIAAERDANANRWLVVKLRLKDSRAP